MERLTKRIGDKVYYIKGKHSPATLCAEMETWEIRECMEKLAKYEDLEEKRNEYRDYKTHGTIEEVKQTLSLLEDIKRREEELGFSGPSLDTQIESEKTKLEALEKQIPKKVVRSIKAKIISHNCPRCGRLFWEYRNGYCSEYCSVCGQRLDWIQAENE